MKNERNRHQAGGNYRLVTDTDQFPKRFQLIISYRVQNQEYK
jgi:hypothetical protein